MAVQQLSGKDLIVFLSSLKPNEYVRFRLISGDASQFLFRINSIDNRNIYPFSYNFHNKVIPNFELDPEMKYCIYDDDQIAFNRAKKDEQLKYLNSIKAFGVCIGCISKNEDKNLILTNCFKFDTFETYVVEENKLYPIKFGNWLRPLKEVDSVKAAVQIKSIQNEVVNGNVVIEIETDDPIPKDPYIEFIEKLENAIDESNLFQCRKTMSNSSDTYNISIFCVKYRLNLLQIVFDLTATKNSYRRTQPEYEPKNIVKISQKFRESHLNSTNSGLVTHTCFPSDVKKAVEVLTTTIENLKERCNIEDKLLCDELLEIINECS